jgi:hypothetical protein
MGKIKAGGFLRIWRLKVAGGFWRMEDGGRVFCLEPLFWVILIFSL